MSTAAAPTRARAAADGGAAAPAPAHIVLRPLGTPVALGLAAILLGTSMLSGIHCTG